MSGGTLNLSLLSRGVGEVHTNGHEKIDVYFEPEDYLNFSTPSEGMHLPTAESKYPSTITDNLTTGYSREFQELRVPKTYSTRKGALLLFSEDLAQKYAVADLEASETVTNKHKVYLRTVEDLANSILKYGSQGHVNDNFYLKFARAHCGTFERQFRPGFSAKRYLSTWTRTWDDSVYDNIIKNGYIAEQSMYQFKLSAPNFRRRLVYEDLSRMPEPYKLMRNMLMMPGSLSGYTFYSTPSQEFDDAGDDQAQHNITNDKSDRLHNIRVIKTSGSVQKEVVYSELDRLSQKEVITDLLVKSAVHYALKTQEEVYKDMVDREISGEEYGENDEEVDEEQGFISSIQEFDMKVAVQSLLDSEHGRLTLGANLSGIGDHSQNADRSGAFKPGTLYSRFSKHQGSHRSSWSGDGSESEKEYVGDVQNVSRRSSSESMTSFSNVPVLPPIRPALSPIKDVSREASQHITLPSLGQGRALVTEAVTSNLAAGIPSSSSFFKSVTGTTKAHGNWKSMDWKSGGESHPGPKKGSRIMAPDGEIISVGGSVVRNNGHDGDIDSLIDVPGQILQSKDVNTDQPSVSDDNVAEKTIENTSTTMIRNKKLHKKKLGGSQRSNVTEYDIMDMLNNHARQVAENVLAHPSAGTDLETDVKLAAELWPKTHSLKLLPRGGEVKADVIGEVIRSRSANSETSSADEYKSLIKKSLNTAVARAAGLEPDSMYDDAEISSDLLETLANQKMTSDQIELVMDSQGHPRIQAKVQQTEDLEIVQDGHRHFIPGKKEEDVADRTSPSQI
uniref:Uncharacterized protein n=1 Tax=Arion vulgaris TaxID=1028688 RepID=A0A0B7AKS0_9EUPU